MLMGVLERLLPFIVQQPVQSGVGGVCVSGISLTLEFLK